MKKFLLIALPVALIAVLASAAMTDNDKRIEIRKPWRHTVALPGAGVRLGVVLSEINPKLRQTMKLDSGVLIEEVFPDGPAAKAGIKDGDILLKVDGQAVTSEQQVRDILRGMKESRQLEMELLRDGKQLNLTVTPEKRPMANLMRHWGGKYIGVSLQELDADLAKYFGVVPDAGVLITRVEKESPAATAGLKSGDVITNFNGEKVNDSGEIREMLNDLEEDGTAKITVMRQGKEQTFDVKPDDRGMPRMPELAELPAFRDLPDLPDFDRNQLEREMSKLREELRDLKNDLPKIEQDIQREMEQLRRELDRLKDSD